jgi:carbamoyltransferase
MLGAVQVSAASRSDLEAAVHVEGTTRSQVVNATECPTLTSVLEGACKAGLPPVLLNASLNDRGEPMGDSMDDAVIAMGSLGLDFIVTPEALLVARR